MSRQLRSIALTLTLALVLSAAGAAHAWPAAGARAAQPVPEESFFTPVRSRLASLFASPEAPAPQRDPGTITQKAGCGMDPDGQPLLWLLNCIL